MATNECTAAVGEELGRKGSHREWGAQEMSPLDFTHVAPLHFLAFDAVKRRARGRQDLQQSR